MCNKKGKKTMVVANGKKCVVVMRAVQEKGVPRAPGGNRKQKQEAQNASLGSWTTRPRQKKLDLLVKKLSKSSRKGEVPKCRIGEGGVTQKAAAGSRSSEAEGDLFVSKVGVLQKDTEKGQESVGHVKAPPPKRRAATSVESAETRNHVSAPPL